MCHKFSNNAVFHRNSHLLILKASVGRPGYYHSPILAFKNVDVRQPVLLHIWSDGVHTCILLLVFLLPPVSSTVPVIWLSSVRLTCPYQRSRFCIKCVVIGRAVASFLISSFIMFSPRLFHRSQLTKGLCKVKKIKKKNLDRAHATHPPPIQTFFGNPSLTWTEHSNHNNYHILTM